MIDPELQATPRMRAKPSLKGKVAVFLDRDGVLVEERGLYGEYLTHADMLRLLPGAAQAVRRLNDAGLPVMVVTNQSVVARGLISEKELHFIHGEMQKMLLEAAGARLDRIYHCPFHPEGTVTPYVRHSDSRKPGAGMLRAAAEDFGLDLTRCYMVGDQESDILAAQKVGCKAIAISTGPYGSQWNSWGQARPDHATKDLASAAAWILDDLSQT